MFEGFRKKLSGFIGQLTGKKELEQPVQPQKIVESKPKHVEHSKKEIVNEQIHDSKKNLRTKHEEKHKTTSEVSSVHVREIGEKKFESRNSTIVVSNPVEGKTIEPSGVLTPSELKEEKVESVLDDRLSGFNENNVKVRSSIESSIVSLVLGSVEIKDKDVDDFLENLRFSLLESDVSLDASDALVESMRKRLVGAKAERGKLRETILKIVTESLEECLSTGKEFKLSDRVSGSGKKPFVILFIGPNGAGKTTTVSKLASMFKSNGLSVVFSASDTFRAAAIEQLGVHASKVGVDMVKAPYGSDPASVAFDAVAFAQSHKKDVVLIDTAGRQDTNQNLLDQLKKIVRVAKPDLKIFVGESMAGHALVDQASAFNNTIGLDGIILTKLDCDAKGGSALSVVRATKVPILFFGTGQSYDKLEEFSTHKMAKLLLPSD